MAKRNLLGKYFGARPRTIASGGIYPHGPSKLLHGKEYAGFVYSEVPGGGVLQDKGDSSRRIVIPNMALLKIERTRTPEIAFAVAETYAQIPRTRIPRPTNVAIVPKNQMTNVTTAGEFNPWFDTATVIDAPETSEKSAKSTFIHEYLHHMERKLPSIASRFKAIDREKSKAPTHYGEKDVHEDFSESGVLYLSGRAGKLSPLRRELIAEAIKAQPLPSIDKKERDDSDSSATVGKSKVWYPSGTPFIFSGGRYRFVNLENLPPRDEYPSDKKVAPPNLYLNVDVDRSWDKDSAKIMAPAGNLKWLKEHGYKYAWGTQGAGDKLLARGGLEHEVIRKDRPTSGLFGIPEEYPNSSRGYARVTDKDLFEVSQREKPYSHNMIRVDALTQKDPRKGYSGSEKDIDRELAELERHEELERESNFARIDRTLKKYGSLDNVPIFERTPLEGGYEKEYEDKGLIGETKTNIYYSDKKPEESSRKYAGSEKQIEEEAEAISKK